jgi:hypothetical protein
MVLKLHLLVLPAKREKNGRKKVVFPYPPYFESYALFRRERANTTFVQKKQLQLLMWLRLLLLQLLHFN